MLSFGDVFIGYNQLKIHLDNKDKLVFITNEGVYCYKVMLVRLKNAKFTYQRMMNKVFTDQIKRNMEAYVDDILVKFKDA